MIPCGWPQGPWGSGFQEHWKDLDHPHDEKLECWSNCKYEPTQTRAQTAAVLISVCFSSIVPTLVPSVM